jgi:hypothetical protein
MSSDQQRQAATEALVRMLKRNSGKGIRQIIGSVATFDYRNPIESLTLASDAMRAVSGFAEIGTFDTTDK